MSLKSTKVYVSSSDSFGSPISHPDLVHGTRSDGNLGPLRSTGLLALPQGSKAFCRRHQSVWLSLMDLQCFSYIILAFIYIYTYIYNTYIHIYICIEFVSRYLARGMRSCWMVLICVAGSTENSNSRLKAARKSSIAGSLVLHLRYP